MVWSAPGNIFFAGEHAVVYGKPAVVASVDRRTRVTIKPRDNGKIIVNSRELGIAEMKNGRKTGKQELMVILDFIKSIVGGRAGFEVEISSDIPIESGLSSSTAVFSSILEALNDYFNLGIGRDEYFDRIIPFQEIVHGGKASGSEIFSSVFGGFHLVKKGKKRLEAIDLGMHKIPVVIGNTRVRAPTKLTVGYHVPSLINRYPEKVEGAWDGIEKIVDKMVTALRNESLEVLGELINENQEILSSLKLSHPKIDDLIEESLKAGAIGAKLSGGGWGGIMFAVCYPDDQMKVADAMRKTGAEIIVTELGVAGIKKENK